MEDFLERVRSALGRAAKGERLAPSELRQIAALKEQLEQTKRDTNDRIEERKDELRQMDARVGKLADAFERETVKAVQKVVARQLDQACRELERADELVSLLFASLETADTALALVRKLKDALETGISEERADKLRDQLENAFAAHERTKAALAGAEEVTFRDKQQEEPEVEQRVEQARTPAVLLSPRAAKVLEERRKRQMETE